MRKTRATTPNGVLKAAARLIREHGWTQHAFSDEQGRICAAKAINECTVPSTEANTLRLEAYGTLLERIGRAHDYLGGVPAWNDMPDQTAEHVLTMLDGG